MKLLIEANVFPEYQDHLTSLAAKNKISYTVWDPKSYPPYDGKDTSVFFFGSILTALNLKAAKYSHQIWLDRQFDYFNFSGHMPELLNAEYLGMSFGALKRVITQQREEDTEPVFIRSNSGYKTVPGHVSLVTDFISQNIYKIFNEEVVIISGIQDDIIAEYRYVIRCEPSDDESDWNYKIISGDTYILNGQFNDSLKTPPQEITDQVIKILNESTYHPFPMFTLDVAHTPYGKAKIIEANSLNTSGLYGNDLEAVLLNLREIIDENKG